MTQNSQNMVIKETKRMAVGVGTMTLIMLIVYAVIGRFSLAVVLGAMMGAGYAVFNFYKLGRTVEKATAVRAENEEQARMQLRMSYQMRMIGMLVIAVLAFVLPFVDGLACIIPMVFPRLWILILQITGQIKDE